jgi:hypothetical protein
VGAYFENGGLGNGWHFPGAGAFSYLERAEGVERMVVRTGYVDGRARDGVGATCLEDGSVGAGRLGGEEDDACSGRHLFRS